MLPRFYINTAALDDSFIEKLKVLFGENKDLVITVTDEEDTTRDLLSSAVNREKFEESISRLRTNNLIEVTRNN